MSAHIIGYYDNIVIMLVALSLALLLRGRIWLAASVQTLAILTQEISLLIGVPLLFFSWLVIRKHQLSDEPPRPFLPLLLPLCAFVALAVSQPVLMDQDFAESFSARLSQFDFIGDDLRILVPVYLSTTFVEFYADQKGAFVERVVSGAMYWLVLPSTLAILWHTASAHRIRVGSIVFVALLGVCFSPLLMHLVAWDTPRIWTYIIVCSFMALWFCSEVLSPRQGHVAARLVLLSVFLANCVNQTPLMDLARHHFDLATRLFLYAPVILGCIGLIRQGDLESTVKLTLNEQAPPRTR